MWKTQTGAAPLTFLGEREIREREREIREGERVERILND